ncbi:hypothetical protein K0M31_003632 [Melipona bicolor]|uniref:Uncharacterized protein n=1 Tax=Melipona bicolor TaxID=60889 RepID=A0AA40FZC1_9HYME|nr:hypothetical protein K0M31_003632 [Melipona bicolor]
MTKQMASSGTKTHEAKELYVSLSRRKKGQGSRRKLDEVPPLSGTGQNPLLAGRPASLLPANTRFHTPGPTTPFGAARPNCRFTARALRA